jgi:hypothetical protein
MTGSGTGVGLGSLQSPLLPPRQDQARINWVNMLLSTIPASARKTGLISQATAPVDRQPEGAYRVRIGDIHNQHHSQMIIGTLGPSTNYC